jgi:ubiquinone/menaquinone biosynthesis C-methylase UbiE
MENLDRKTVEGFGYEWSSFDQTALSNDELLELFLSYFELFPWKSLPENAVGFDLGCGSGRWAKFVADKVGTLHCIDASAAALEIAKSKLKDKGNCQFHLASVDNIPLENNSMDFGYALGVLHHIPDPLGGMKACVKKLKPGAPFLVYIYYAFDNRPYWFRLIWRISDILRRVISKLPYFYRYWITQVIAVVVYYPLARFALVLEKIGFKVELMPLSAYRNSSFYTMRTDALDRFGTRLEHRFTAQEIEEMMKQSGLNRIVFSDSCYWCALGYKTQEIERGIDDDEIALK